MGLFGKIFNGIMGKDERNMNEIAFEKSVIKDGPEYAGMRVAQIINEKITSIDLAKQFVLEELDAARQGNNHAVKFVQQSGFKPSEYIGAMSKTKWEGDESELEHLQLYFRYFLMQIKDIDLMVKLSTSTVNEIMKMYHLGKYDFIKNKSSDDLSLEKQLSNNLLSNKMKANMYNQVRKLKDYTDQLMFNQSQKAIDEYRDAILKAFEPAVEIYEWLQEKGISQLNAIIILASFYLVNLSDMTLKDPKSFTEQEISNTVDTFLAAMGATGKVSTSSYNALVRIGINWLLSHPMD
jgi:hypothetical protein